MSYHEPVVEVIGAVQRGDTVRTSLSVVTRGSLTRLSPPLAPASLVTLDDPTRSLFDLHRAIASDSGLSYETYDTQHQLPTIGRQYLLRFWWDQRGLDAVIDRDATWVRQPYPAGAPGTHDHCLLTWETIAAHSEHPVAYRSHHGWLTDDAYEQYIAQDVLRLRRPPATS